jgi:tRNA threonylcarbamoyladenosine biosynthesis protein TsaE
MKWTSTSPEETQELGRKLLKQFPKARVICLKGPLGSGKTCFTKGIGESLNIQKNQIKSPTFTTLLEHYGNLKLLHLDFYRHEKVEDLSRDWWEELLDQPNAVIVAEWAERIEPHLPEKRIDIEFIDKGGNERHLILTER